MISSNSIETLYSYKRKNKEPLQIERLGSSHYLIFHRHKIWELWTNDKCWHELNPNDGNHSEVFYGDVTTFIKKNILNDKTIPANHGKVWTEEEIKSALELALKGLSCDEVAEKLQRKPIAVIMKLEQHLGREPVNSARIRHHWKTPLLSLLNIDDTPMKDEKNNEKS